METTKADKWMPVFAVIEGTKKRFAAYPGQESSIPEKRDSDKEDYELRVGTALLQNDGSYKIHLIVSPIDGRLFMRPPHRGEYQDLTQMERSS